MANYPPYIESKLPAQYGDTLSIPFEPSRATVSASLKCRIKTISTNQEIVNTNGSIQEGNIASFNISSSLTSGQYYKIQLADGDSTSNLYSSVGIFKYIGTNPIVEISFTQGIFQAKYSHDNEQLYSYRFDLYDNENNLYESSGDLIWNASLDNSTEIFYIPKVIKQDFYCRFSYHTINDLENFVLSNNISIALDTSGELTIISFPSEGYNEITKNENNTSLVRSEMGLNTWTVLTKSNVYKDYLLESNTEYQYGVYNNNTNTISITDTIAFNTYEDMFLNDKERQLKIQFNPKVSSFKNVILENKIDTIGHKYPIFFRNAQVKYKEFPISGLISYLSDPENLFLNMNNINENADIGEFTTDLTPQNIQKEKKFRLEVLEWLSNGQPKLFRSPTEGVYIVRLMNISLTPNDTLGRMLYTFSATAYEIADLTYDNLVKYNLSE